MALSYAWDSDAQRYRGSNGRFVAEGAVRAALDDVLAAESAQMRALAAQLQQGRLTVAEWQSAMAPLVKQAQILGATAAQGGWAQMDAAAWGRVGAATKAQYGYLRDFAAEIADGRQPLNGALLSRAELYGAAGRSAYGAEQRRMAEGRYDQERSVLGSVATEHCPGCVAEAGRGWRPLGSLVPPGQRSCQTRCRCHLTYRRSGAA